MIELGLHRISQLLQPSKLPWKAIHVAGTNGKGSICAYLSAMLHKGGVRAGKFTSPHLVDRWDCITINEKCVDASLFRRVEDQIKLYDKQHKIGASEFEILTATAFEIFTQAKVEVAVVEVGLGGREDATNCLEHVLVSIIAKIGMDHQSILGDRIEDIAYQKAGIIKPNVPCVVDGSNPPSVLRTIEACARDVRSGGVLYATPLDPSTFKSSNTSSRAPFQTHQMQNLGCAVEAIRIGFPALRPQANTEDIIPAAVEARNPGRLQHVNLKAVTGDDLWILLDGAHNAQSADVLGQYVNQHLRQNNRPVTWVFAASNGKDIREIGRLIFQAGDIIHLVEFGPVDGMPWVRPASKSDMTCSITDLAGEGKLEVQQGGATVAEALNMASQTSKEQKGPLVIAGSLYLVSDVLRLLRQAEDAPLP